MPTGRGSPLLSPAGSRDPGAVAYASVTSSTTRWLGRELSQLGSDAVGNLPDDECAAFLMGLLEHQTPLVDQADQITTVKAAAP